MIIPIIIFVWMVVQQVSVDLTTLETRRAGLVLNGLTKDFLQDVQQHRAIANSFLSGDASYQQKMKAKQQEIEQDIQKIETLLNESVSLSGVLEKWTDIKQAWITMVPGFEGVTAAEAVEQHTAYIGKVLDFMVAASENSNLYLANNMENYYVISSIVKTLPELSEKLGQVRANGLTVLNTKQLTPELERKLIDLYSSVTSRNQTLEHEMEMNTSPTVKSAYEKMQEQTAGFLNLVDKELLKSSSIQYSPAAYMDVATKTIDSSFVVLDEQQKYMEGLLQDASDQLSNQRTITIMLSTLVILLAIYGFIAFYLSINRSITLLKEATLSLADGDLKIQVELETRDEMSQVSTSFNQTAHKLRHLIQQVGNNSEQVAASAEQLNASADQTSKATEQIASTAQELAAGSEQQVQNITDSSQSVKEMSMGIQRIASNAQHVSEVASQAAEIAQNGNQSIHMAIQQMNAIQQTILGLADVVKGLGIRSGEIGTITSAITGIAGQTNLLALNAAIEAARAGEHGRGFAVVADEVRKLAEDASGSARQITALIQDIQAETSKAVESMEQGTKEVQEGIYVVNNARLSFTQINQFVNEVAKQIKEVSTATQTLSVHTQKVVASMDEINELSSATAYGTQSISAGTEEQLASMEEISASANALSKMAEELQELISTFKV
ncbi:methyl-accepting chemotaxis protein [Brevibacillus migulae]|uniref:methyl-accepting chemotaxis protein n=1 Tax=Brevibacillus migulae TaxID=1644114 RepID=UPI001431327B|nr:HAMP domain-containing methyl-accepting chemotaxis protein [Brevibacillus migulae]